MTTPEGAVAAAARAVKSRSSSSRKAKRQHRDASKQGGGRQYQQATLDKIWAQPRKRRVDSTIDFDADPDGVVDLTQGATTSKARRTATNDEGAAVDEAHQGDGAEPESHGGGAADREQGSAHRTEEGDRYPGESGDLRERTPG